MFWALVKLGLKFSLGLIFIMFCFLCNIALITVITSQSLSDSGEYLYIDGVAQLLYRGSTHRLTQGYHGIYDGYYGYDYSGGCGAALYSPLPGRGVVTYNAVGDGLGNTMIRITGDAGEVVLLHGDYSYVDVGDIVHGGSTRIGTEASIGNSTGCHSHIVWKPNIDYNGPLLKRNEAIAHTGVKGNYGSVLDDYRNVHLKISQYNPYQGGVNCDSDCSTMASGDLVADWVLGQGGVYAAACPQEWPIGTQFHVDKQVYECRDHGGYINCYAPGDYDPALNPSDALGQILVETEPYCWVDLMADAGYSYGYKTTNWSFVR